MMKGDPVMRTVLVMLMTAFSIACARLSTAGPCDPAATVRIHDYVHVQNDAWSTAAEIVTRAYKNFGIGIQWLGVSQFDVGGKRPSGEEGANAPVAQFTINILTPAMAARGGVPSQVLGFVAVPPEGGMGRIGYVVYEHVPDVAAASQMSVGEILGIIVAHDIRRLILGVSSQSGDDAVGNRGNGNKERVNPLALQFTPQEIGKLHAALLSNTPSGQCEVIQ